MACYVLKFVVLREDEQLLQWTLFHELDMRDEAEQTSLAMFLERFAKEVPTVLRALIDCI